MMNTVSLELNRTFQGYRLDLTPKNYVRNNNFTSHRCLVTQTKQMEIGPCEQVMVN